MTEPRCAICAGTIPVGAPVLREVTGWVAPRRGGGTHHLRLQAFTGKVAHAACLLARERPQGEQLF